VVSTTALAFRLHANQIHFMATCPPLAPLTTHHSLLTL
jgi:hypothetical protein